MSDGQDAPGGEAQAPETQWTDHLPETIRSWDEVKNAKSPEDFWNQMTNHRSMVGRSVQIPTGDASEEDRTKFFDRMKQHFPDITRAPDYDNPETAAEVRRRMGMPENAEGYRAPEFEVPEGVSLDEKAINGYRDLAHQEGLTQAQYEALVKATVGTRMEELAQQNQTFNDELSRLKSEWGAAFDEKAAEAEKIRKEFFDFIPEGAMNAHSIKAMERISKQFGAENPNLTATADQVRKHALTPSEARHRANEIMSDKKGPYWDVRHPMHQQTKKKYRDLLQVANS